MSDILAMTMTVTMKTLKVLKTSGLMPVNVPLAYSEKGGAVVGS